ncbi:MAG: bile acid:sodium symporter family protein [Candidatus Auribacterota bacterium]|jgi:BASS family bile acid:Na+ symporter|nr:bile acid:sodium symporter family protein [Candidatus Auribacterota bacterium]
MATHKDWFFALTMFGIGAILDKEDFKRIAGSPLIVLLGTVAQFTVMPLGAYVVAKLFNLQPELALGLIVAGTAPGAMASNVMCYIAGADTAYSVSLTTVSTLLTPIMIPGLTYLLANSIIHVPFMSMFFDVIYTVILPLITGFWLRHVFDKRMTKIIKIFPAVSATFIIFICSLVIAINKSYLSMITGIVFGAVITLNVSGLTAGFLIGHLFGLSTRRKRTLSIEIGMQNAGLGTILVLNNFGERSAIPTAAFVFVCIITASILSEIWRRYDLIRAIRPDADTTTSQ